VVKIEQAVMEDIILLLHLIIIQRYVYFSQKWSLIKVLESSFQAVPCSCTALGLVPQGLLFIMRLHHLATAR
jgi:hypothetical protein